MPDWQSYFNRGPIQQALCQEPRAIRKCNRIFNLRTNGGSELRDFMSNWQLPLQVRNNLSSDLTRLMPGRSWRPMPPTLAVESVILQAIRRGQ